MSALPNEPRANTLLRHPQGSSILLFREDYLAICRSNKPMAAVLSILDYLTSRAVADGKSEWISISQQEISLKAFSLFNRKTINLALQKLRECNFLLSRVSNLTSLNRVQEHWLNVVAIQDAIDTWSATQCKEANNSAERVILPDAMGSAEVHVRELDSPIKESNTSTSNEVDTTLAQQPQDMVSDDEPTDAQYSAAFDFVMAKYATTPESGGVLVEAPEGSPSKVPAKVSPSVVTVNRHDTTVIMPRDPIFDSIARLQFDVPEGETVPKATAGRVAKLVKVVVDAYKERSNVTALSPHERDGLARIHAKFWTWYTTVKYPQSGGKKIELRSHTTFDLYWHEYRRYVAAQTTKPDYDAPAEWRYDDGN